MVVLGDFALLPIQEAIDIACIGLLPKCRSRSYPCGANDVPAFVMVCGATML